MDSQSGPIVLILICILAILAVAIYIYFQMENTKKYVRSELSKFATLVNDAQYNEFTFDKLTESNIRVIDNRLKTISQQLRAMKGGLIATSDE
jgi:flagellar basal body-associated protein FliL